MVGVREHIAYRVHIKATAVRVGLGTVPDEWSLGDDSKLQPETDRNSRPVFTRQAKVTRVQTDPMTLQVIPELTR